LLRERRAEYTEIATVDLVLSLQVSLCAREQNVLLSSGGGRMEVQDGFIVNVSSFCDRWCARCALTARCELFVKNNSDRRTTTADSRLSLLGQVEMMRDAARKHPAEALPREPGSKLPADLERSSMEPSPEVVRNSAALHRKRQRARFSANASVRGAIETIEHFTLFVPVKMLLCLGTVSRDGQGAQQSDANGWGKAALLGLERMRAAWTLLVDTHHYSESDVAPFLSEISRMQRNLERAVPKARAFVRPGFDEMEQVSLLDSKLRRH
jgi:hypothetical protein